MRAQSIGYELRDRPWQRGRQIEESRTHPRRVECAVGNEERRAGTRPSFFDDKVVGISALSTPPNDVFCLAMLVVGQLKRHGPVFVIEPDDQIHLVREEPAAPRFAADLIDVLDFVQ